MNQHSARNASGTGWLVAARISFAALLFVSPSMWRWFSVSRPLPPVYDGYTDFLLYPSDLFMGLTIFFGFGAVLVSQVKFQFGPRFLTLALAALTLLGFVSALSSVDAPLTFYHSFRFLALFGLYLVLVNLPMPAKWVALPLALAVMMQSAVAILQFVNQTSLGLMSLGELALNPAETGTSILRIGDTRILRAYGLTDHPNLLGGFLAFALIFVLGYYLASKTPWRPLLLIPLALGLVALFYTFSRSAQLAFSCGVAFLFAMLWRDSARRSAFLRDVGIVLVVSIGALLLPAWDNQRLLALRVGQANAFQENVSEARSVNERTELIDSARRVFLQRPFSGVGNGALTIAMFHLDSEFPHAAYTYQPAHLVAVVAAAELGMFGGALWLWLMLAPLAALWVWRAKIFSHAWAAACAAVIVVLVIVGLFDYYPWFWQAGRVWQWSAWGLFAAIFFVRGVNE